MELGARMRALREKRGLSLSKLTFALYDPEAQTNYDASFLGRVERGDKESVPERLLRGYGDVLGPTIEELPEYHLARARALLDEQVVGLDQALANLNRLAAAQPDEAAALLDRDAEERRLLDAAPRSATRARRAATRRKAAQG